MIKLADTPESRNFQRPLLALIYNRTGYKLSNFGVIKKLINAGNYLHYLK
ncbi:MAG: hypothetical protein ACI952_001349 [Flavobacteriales bacterium]|jgi:hypothetical protein